MLGLATAAAMLGAVGCGGARQDAEEASGDYPLAITEASFPAQQVLAQQTRLTISVRNTGTREIPDIALTITTPGPGTAARAFADIDTQPGLASRSRPVWILDRGPGGGDTVASDTWALGRLAAGRTRTFTWEVTAVKGGRHAVHYRVAAGLNGKAHAVLSGGGVPEGDFVVNIDSRAQQAIVTDSGRIKNIGPAK